MKKTFNRRYELRCYDTELVAWHKLAHKHDLELSAYIRAILNKAHIPSKKLSANPELIRQLAAIGNNLNQLSHWANTYKRKAEIKTIEVNIEKIKLRLDQVLKNHIRNDLC